MALLLARYFKVYAIYRLPTCSMDPAFHIDQIIFGSCLLKVEKGDVAAYWAEPLPYDETDEEYEAICRIVATENDTVELRKGLLFINGIFTDDTMNLSYHFEIPARLVEKNLSEYQRLYKMNIFGEKVILNASYAELELLGVTDSALKVGASSYVIEPEVFGVNSGETWTFDDFGPVVVPKDSYFMLGDNRSNSADCRIRGFIHKDRIIAKIVSGK